MGLIYRIHRWTSQGDERPSVGSKRIRLAHLLLPLLLITCGAASAQTRRIIVFKVDGLPNDTVDRFVRERDPQTGKSQLPWIDYVFYRQGTRLANFYVRGISLSGPSWSMIDTGQHLQIKGNIEFDRFTGATHDYLNLFPFLLEGAKHMRADTEGVEVLDQIGVPLLIDAYPWNQRYPGFSLFQRGTSFVTFERGFMAHFRRSAKDVFDEWTTGLEFANTPSEGELKDVIDHLQDPRMQYLGLMVQDFDHAAHGNRDPETQLGALKRIDSFIGRIWAAVQTTPLASQTALILVSDHGINTDEQVISQGYNLVQWLGSSAGGGHHVVTKQRQLMDYSLHMNPLVQSVTTTSPDSYYLKGKSDRYPTALMDCDGNERASLHLRNSDLNLLQILLQQLQRSDLAPEMHRAAVAAVLTTIDRHRTEWQRTFNELQEELQAARHDIVRQRDHWAAQSKKFTRADQESGRDNEVWRMLGQLNNLIEQERDYTEYERTLGDLLRLTPQQLSSPQIRVEDFIARRAMGDRNSLYQLQHYVIGLAPGGIVLDAKGALDMDQSFLRVDYFSELERITVLNNVQADVSHQPIDFIVTQIPAALVGAQLGETGPLFNDAVWIYGGEDRQALILARQGSDGQLNLRYHPIRRLAQQPDGSLRFEVTSFAAGDPLNIFADQDFTIRAPERAAWLGQWHTDTQWLEAVHRTQYSNGLIGLYEEVARHWLPGPADESTSSDVRLMRRFRHRQRDGIEFDLLMVAKNHWNFNIMGFNPGGNHGSFNRSSTHATWMISGGELTGIPKGSVVEEPYDGLSFVPTLLALTGRLNGDDSPAPSLAEKGFRPFPGRVVKELVERRETTAPIAQ